MYDHIFLSRQGFNNLPRQVLLKKEIIFVSIDTISDYWNVKKNRFNGIHYKGLSYEQCMALIDGIEPGVPEGMIGDV